eukprot:4359028-Amphidinium_carterae.1
MAITCGRRAATTLGRRPRSGHLKGSDSSASSTWPFAKAVLTHDLTFKPYWRIKQLSIPISIT